MAALVLVVACAAQEQEMPADIYCGDMNCYEVRLVVVVEDAGGGGKAG